MEPYVSIFCVHNGRRHWRFLKCYFRSVHYSAIPILMYEKNINDNNTFSFSFFSRIHWYLILLEHIRPIRRNIILYVQWWTMKWFTSLFIYLDGATVDSEICHVKRTFETWSIVQQIIIKKRDKKTQICINRNTILFFSCLFVCSSSPPRPRSFLSSSFSVFFLVCLCVCVCVRCYWKMSRRENQKPRTTKIKRYSMFMLFLDWMIHLCVSSSFFLSSVLSSLSFPFFLTKQIQRNGNHVFHNYSWEYARTTKYTPVVEERNLSHMAQRMTYSFSIF